MFFDPPSGGNTANTIIEFDLRDGTIELSVVLDRWDIMPAQMEPLVIQGDIHNVYFKRA